MTPAMRLLRSTLALLLVSGAAAEAQDPRAAPLALQLPASARAHALADAWTGARDADAVFYNPAQLHDQRTAATFFLARYGSASTAGGLAAVMPMGWATLGFGAQYLDYGDPAPVYVLDQVDPPLLQRSVELTHRGGIDAASTVVAVGAGFELIGVRWGVTGKAAEDRDGTRKDGVLVADIGAAKEIGPFSVGAALRNLGSDPEMLGVSRSLPTRLAVGVQSRTVPAGAFDIGMNAEVALLRWSRGFIGGGAEVSWTPIEGISGVGRIGARTPVGDYESPITLGAGFSFDRVSVDYAWEGFRGPGSGHRIGVRLR